MIKIFGHKAPDADSTGSPLIWEWYLNECKGKTASAKLLGQPNTEAAFMLDRWGFPQPEIIADVDEEDSVVIVDTNNPAELPPSINRCNVIEVIDHHLLQGGLKTRFPIKVTMRPLACTATIMNELMGQDAKRMPKGIQGLMLTCILSDTLEFRSPTTTDVDRTLAEQLASSLELSIPEYAAAMFEAKSDVSAFSDAELLRLDSKQYETGGKKLRVSVIETTNPPSILGRRRNLMDSMDAAAKEDGSDAILLFVIDILNEEATLLVPNDLVRSVAEKTFSAKVESDTLVLPGVVSRKKQIVPYLAA